MSSFRHILATKSIFSDGWLDDVTEHIITLTQVTVKSYCMLTFKVFWAQLNGFNVGYTLINCI